MHKTYACLYAASTEPPGFSCTSSLVGISHAGCHERNSVVIKHFILFPFLYVKKKKIKKNQLI